MKKYLLVADFSQQQQFEFDTREEAETKQQDIENSIQDEATVKFRIQEIAEEPPPQPQEKVRQDLPGVQNETV